MDFDYVVIPALILVVGVLVVWFCIRRMVSLPTKSYGTWRKVAERIVLSTVVLLVTGVTGICTFNAIKIQVFRAANPPFGKLYTVNGKKMRLYCTVSVFL
jgi:hypothetical protein